MSCPMAASSETDMSQNIRPMRTRRNKRPRTLVGQSLRVGLYLFGMILILSLMAAFGLLVLRIAPGTNIALQDIANYRAYGYLMQLTLIFVLAVKWRTVVAWLVNRGFVSEEARHVLLARKNRWIGTLVLFELLLLFSAIADFTNAGG